MGPKLRFICYTKHYFDTKKNSILLKLPENNIKEALENYKKIYINFSNEELIEIESIDLRMKKKIILKYKESIK